jgi:transcriptional regulator with XRE-family HTH domain
VEKALFDYFYVASASGRSRARTPELDLPASFSRKQVESWLVRIRSVRLRTRVRAGGVRQRKKGPIDPRLGERVRALRKAEKMTQAQVAGNDFTKGFVSQIESGRSRASLRTATIIAERLGVSLYVLLADDDAPHGEIGIEATLNSAIKRTEELESYAIKTRTELKLALAAVLTARARVSCVIARRGER